jgi:pimeloyl-ACP methyl ester carboxylesterase
LSFWIKNQSSQSKCLFVGISAEDAVCKPELIDAAKQQGLVPHLEEVTVESAHWSPMEKPDEIAWHIRNFLVNVSLHERGSHRS